MQCTAGDAAWLMELGQKMYGKLLQNHEKTLEWLISNINSPDSLVLRTDESAIICVCRPMPFSDFPVASVVLFAGKPWDLTGLFREAKIWAKSKGAEKLHFRSTTEYDIEPLAKRIGAKIEYPAYSVRL